MIDAGLDAINISVDASGKEVFERRGSASSTTRSSPTSSAWPRCASERGQAPSQADSVVRPPEQLRRRARVHRALAQRRRQDSHHRSAQLGGHAEPESDVHYPCYRPWLTFTVLWDGRVSLCCADFDGRTILGDLRTSTIQEIWNSEGSPGGPAGSIWNPAAPNLPVLRSAEKRLAAVGDEALLGDRPQRGLSPYYPDAYTGRSAAPACVDPPLLPPPGSRRRVAATAQRTGDASRPPGADPAGARRVGPEGAHEDRQSGTGRGSSADARAERPARAEGAGHRAAVGCRLHRRPARGRRAWRVAGTTASSSSRRAPRQWRHRRRRGRVSPSRPRSCPIQRSWPTARGRSERRGRAARGIRSSGSRRSSCRPRHSLRRNLAIPNSEGETPANPGVLPTPGITPGTAPGQFTTPTPAVLPPPPVTPPQPRQ